MAGTIIITAVVAVVAGGCVVYVMRKTLFPKPGDKKSHHTPAVNTEPIIEFLKDSEEEYFPKFLSYFIYKNGMEQGLSISQLRELDEEYGEHLAEPVIDWRILISKLNNKQVDSLLGTVKDYLKQKQYEIHDENCEYSDLFEKYLKDKAFLQAKEIIAKVVKNGED